MPVWFRQKGAKPYQATFCNSSIYIISFYSQKVTCFLIIGLPDFIINRRRRMKKKLWENIRCRIGKYDKFRRILISLQEPYFKNRTVGAEERQIFQ